MVELGNDTEQCEGNVKCFTMDEAFLNDLLECSVCLEQLDCNSKVLPCQHTFCKRCLQEIVNSHKELRCPECRILVDVKIEELPCNILLVRLLEGIKNNVRPKRTSCVLEANTRTSSEAVTETTPPHPQLPQQLGHHSVLAAGDLRTVPKQVLQPCPCAKALYPYEAKVPGDLTFKKGDIIILRKRVDQNWFYGELGGKSGFVPASFVQVVVPITSHVPQCKALYDFQISSSEEKDCLTFGKGDILTVIRRIDDHWAEGKLRERIGIFPISFVEMNAAARAVMKLSLNISQGSSRIVPPPAPSTESHFISAQTTVTTSVVSSNTSSDTEVLSTVGTSFSMSESFNSPFSSSSFASPSHHSNTTATLQGTVVSVAQQVPHGYGIGSFSGTSHDVVPSSGPSHHRQSLPLQQMPQTPTANSQVSEEQCGFSDGVVEGTIVAKSRSTPSPGPVFTCVAAVTPPVITQRAESMSGDQNSNNSSCLENNALSCTSSLPTDVTNRISHPPTHVPVPHFYLALYTYRPQKDDELELRKGELYTVSEKCQDGWFKGVSLRTGQSGVFPGNYVQLAKAAVFQSPAVTSPPGQIPVLTSPPIPSIISGQPRTVATVTDDNPTFHTAVQGIIYTNSPTSVGNCRSAVISPSPPVSLSHPAVSEWAHSVATIATHAQRLSRPTSTVGGLPVGPYKPDMIPKQNGMLNAQSRFPNLSPWTPGCTSESSTTPYINEFSTRTVNASPTRMLSYQSPSPSSINSSGLQTGNSQGSLGSVSQPSTPLMMPHTSLSSASTNPFIASSSDRGSCSSSTGSCSPTATAVSIPHTRIDKHKEKKEKEIVSLMKRLTKRKSKSPPPSDYSCDNPSFVDAMSAGSQSLATVHVRSTSCPSEALGSQGITHKKTGSFDSCGNSDIPRTASRPKQPAPLVRERFRCIVPYPPNSDYELELKVGDVVYVHKKREDGWYKGTLQRTGKTGLFPSSFVESF